MNSAISPAALGLRLMQLRDAAGIKQAELARQVTWSQAVLTRVEAGDRVVSSDELAQLLKVIGTTEALELERIVAREWRHLPAPPLDHPDHGLLWAADETSAELAAHAEAEDIRPAFLRRLQEYQEEIRQAASQLLRR